MIVHETVLIAETCALLAPAPGKLFVDGTVGGGGHSEAFLEAGARVIGLDQDAEALGFARERLARFGDRFVPVHANFKTVVAVLDGLGEGGIEGGLLDIGVSSWQLDTPERGFSFRFGGPLDMRMNREQGRSAADIVNTAPEEELARIFWEYGEEWDARRIARRIVEERPFEGTLELAGCVERVKGRGGKVHAATKVFQALRIAVNGELEALEEGLEGFASRLKPGGRLGVISFHSLEDRRVKEFFRAGSREWIDRPEWPERRRNPRFRFRVLTGRPVVAGGDEVGRNPRSRSAKLRVVERMPL